MRFSTDVGTLKTPVASPLHKSQQGEQGGGDGSERIKKSHRVSLPSGPHPKIKCVETIFVCITQPFCSRAVHSCHLHAVSNNAKITAAQRIRPPCSQWGASLW